MSESPKALEAEVEANRASVESTLSALREKASVEGVVRDMGRYVGMGDPRETLQAAGREVNANPLAFGLIAAGIACLATGVARRNTQPDYVRPYDGMDDGSVGDSSPGRLHQYGDKVREGYGAATGKVREGYGAATGRLREGYGAASDAAHQATEAVQSRYRDMRHSASDFSQRATQQVTQQPLIFGALALAAGAVLGAALPTSRTENRWLGPTHDRLTEGARSAASELKERAAAAAEAGLAAASSAAKDEGLIPENSTLAERVQHVAEAATQEAAETFRDPSRPQT